MASAEDKKKDTKIVAESAASLSQIDPHRNATKINLTPQASSSDYDVPSNPTPTPSPSHEERNKAESPIGPSATLPSSSKIVNNCHEKSSGPSQQYGNISSDFVDGGKNNAAHKQPVTSTDNAVVKKTDRNANENEDLDGIVAIMIDERRTKDKYSKGLQQQSSTDTTLRRRRSVTSSHYNTRQRTKPVVERATDELCKMFGVLFAVGVRAVLFAFCFFLVWLVVYRLQNDWLWLLALTFILLFIETITIVVKRAGQERKWFCACFFCYLVTAIPCVWLLELDRLETFQNAVTNSSSLSLELPGVTTEVKLDPNTLLSVTEQCLVFLLILARWLLPRGDISRDQLSQLLFVYIGMASDVMELFELFDEHRVRADRTLTCIILTVWSVSMLQFTLVLTMSLSPKKPRTATDHTHEGEDEPMKRGGCGMVFVQSEMWSLVVSMFMQDGPFLGVRLYTLLTYKLMTYSIIFFTCKNILVITLLFYRTLVLCLRRNDEPRHTRGTVKEGRFDEDVEASKAFSYIGESSSSSGMLDKTSKHS